MGHPLARGPTWGDAEGSQTSPRWYLVSTESPKAAWKSEEFGAANMTRVPGE